MPDSGSDQRIAPLGVFAVFAQRWTSSHASSDDCKTNALTHTFFRSVCGSGLLSLAEFGFGCLFLLSCCCCGCGGSGGGESDEGRKSGGWVGSAPFGGGDAGMWLVR